MRLLGSYQKQPSRGVFRKRCSENMQQIYRRTPMPKCDFNKVAKHYGMGVLCNLIEITLRLDFDQVKQRRIHNPVKHLRWNVL